MSRPCCEYFWQAVLFAKDEEAVEAAFKSAVEALTVDEDSEI
jgi:hypothetical protein